MRPAFTIPFPLPLWYDRCKSLHEYLNTKRSLSQSVQLSKVPVVLRGELGFTPEQFAPLQRMILVVKRSIHTLVVSGMQRLDEDPGEPGANVPPCSGGIPCWIEIVTLYISMTRPLITQTNYSS